jgi:peptide/nickel transport system permease protein
MSSASVPNPMTADPLPPRLPTNPVEGVATPRSWLGQVLLQTVGATGARVGLVWIVIVAFCAVFAPYLANSFPFVAKVDGRVFSPMYRHLSGVDVLLPVVAIATLIVWRLRSMAVRQKVAVVLWVLLAMVIIGHWQPMLHFIQSITQSFSASMGQDLVKKPPPSWWAWTKFIVLCLSLAGMITSLVLLAIKTRVSLAAKLVTLIGVTAVALPLVLFPLNPTPNPIYSTYRDAAVDGRMEWSIPAPIPFSPSDRLFDIAREAKNPPPHAPSWVYSSGGNWKGDRPPPPWYRHLMGTDLNGADILSNMIHACRIAMSIGFISTGIAVVIAILVGGAMGYFVGWVDLLGMRLVEIFASIPTLYLLLALVAFVGRNLYLMMVIIGFTSWVGKAYFVRAEFLKLRKQDFVQAAIAAGLPLRSVLFRHLLPNALAPLLVSASFTVASAILAESTLSFLGLGPPEAASWGRLLDQARSAGGGFYWWLATFPGFAIFLTVLAYNLIGESFRDAIDPRTRSQGQ